MTISATKFYTSVFVILLLLQLYIPSFKLNIAVQLCALILFVIIDRVSVTKSFLKHLYPFALLLLIGFMGTLLHRYKGFNVIKDVFHFIKPITGLLIGYICYKRINNFRLFAKAVVTAGIISALMHFFIIVFLVELKSGSIHEIREFSKDNFLELFALFFLVFYKKFHGYALYKNRIYSVIVLMLLSASVFLYFSRTMIIAGLILAVSAFGITKITSKSLKYIGLFFIAIAMFYAYLYSTTIRRDKPGLEAFLYKVKIAPAEIFETNINRDNHRDLWDHWRGYEAKRAFELMTQSPSSFIFGTGHGSLVNLKFFAPLTGDRKGIKYISELHNGYMYVLYKTGLIGLLVYLSVLFRWYMYIYKYSHKNLIAVLISAISIIYVFSTMTITGLYNNRDILIMLVGALLYYAQPPVVPNDAPELQPPGASGNREMFNRQNES